MKKACCEACHLQLMKTEEDLTELKAGVLSASQEVSNICDQLKLLEEKISERKKVLMMLKVCLKRRRVLYFLQQKTMSQEGGD